MSHAAAWVYDFLEVYSQRAYFGKLGDILQREAGVVAVVVLIGSEGVNHVVVDLAKHTLLEFAADVDAAVVELQLHCVRIGLPRTSLGPSEKEVYSCFSELALRASSRIGSLLTACAVIISIKNGQLIYRRLPL